MDAEKEHFEIKKLTEKICRSQNSHNYNPQIRMYLKT